MEDAEEIQEWRVMLMRLMKRESGRRTVFELSESIRMHIRMTGQCIRPGEKLPRDMDNFQVKVSVTIPYLALSFFLRLLFLFTDDTLVLLII